MIIFIRIDGIDSVQFNSVAHSCPTPPTPWTAACQTSLSINNTQSLPKVMSIQSVMQSTNLILCHPLLLPPSIFPSIRVFSNESALPIWWPKYWSFSFNISPTNEWTLYVYSLTQRSMLISTEPWTRIGDVQQIPTIWEWGVDFVKDCRSKHYVSRH